jgi:hypothetical protein
MVSNWTALRALSGMSAPKLQEIEAPQQLTL